MSSIEFLDQAALSLEIAINEAFGGLQYPGDNEIMPQMDCERRQIYRKLRGKHWKNLDLTKGDLLKLPVLPLLSDIGFQFYLPAYMLAALQSPDGPAITFDILFWLDPPRDRKMLGEFFLPRMNRLTQRQRHVVYDFIALMFERYPDETKYEPDRKERMFNYWNSRDDHQAVGGLI